MLLSLKDDDDDENVIEEDSDNTYGDDYDKAEKNTHNNGRLDGVNIENENSNSVMQQTVLAFDEQDFFGRHNNHLLRESFTHKGHIHPQRVTNANANQQLANVATTPQTNTTSSLLNTQDINIITISPSTSPSLDVKTIVDEITESSTSNKASNSNQQPYSNSNSPHFNSRSRTNSPASRHQQQQQQISAPRLFSSNILPANLRQESYSTHDDTDEICLVPEVDFECSSIMDHSTDNRESQPLLGGGPSGSAACRDHFDAICNTFTGKFISLFTYFY